MNKRFLILTLFIGHSLLTTNKNFVFVIPSYKNEMWYKRNLDSVFEQTYKIFRVIYIADDIETGDLVAEYIKQRKLENKIKLKQNKERKLALYNIYYAIHSCHDDEIIICLDGDDWLENKYVLAYLNKIYQDDNVWLTYGQYREYPKNIIGGCRELPFEIIKNKQVRKYQWLTTHLRTFYAGLFKQIKKDDLLFGGKFFPMAWDVAFMLPLIELAYDKTRFINKVLYVYNIANPINDNKVDKELQCNLFTFIRSKNCYEKTENFVCAINQEKVDIVIFSYDFENLKILLDNLNDSNHAGKIIVFNKYDFDNLDLLRLKYSNVEFLNLKHLNYKDISDIVEQLFLNDNKHICVLNDNLQICETIDLNNILKKITETQSYCLYFFSQNNILSIIINNIDSKVAENIYKFEFEEYNLSPFINGLIMNKSEIRNSYNPNNIRNFEIEWRYIGWKKNCLAQILGN